MAYTSKEWLNRIRSRTDMSSYLFHLTKSNDFLDGKDVLLKILQEKTLIGSKNSGYIIGKNKAVCFQDVPPYSLSQNCFHEQQIRKLNSWSKIRYKPIGLAFPKHYVYQKGGRPVIYDESSLAKEYLPEEEWWRIVDFDLTDKSKITDWTHEREWRVKGDFTFDLSKAVILLPTSKNYKEFLDRAPDSLLKGIAGVVLLDPVLS
ncbi:DUF2971 domain-containing protein [Paenibacillus peoriae]|uniref:DUF2971 domain-containing protein n=1 Tax=Paenibacillus peoriae TaxID=59893 RepID=UPI00026C5651|nr:DUF2971 domain-containing protein [Paenibacillus peoriae]MEC0181726.1 DUF2971 domain-containing protein [Paenibacillus peoriae]